VAQQGNLPIIHTISGGFGGGGESNSARKAYARQLDDFEVYSVQKPPKSRKYNPLVIGFSDDDYAGVSLPHTDALVVTLTIANYQTRRILVDTGSSADILFKSAFDYRVFHEKSWSRSHASYRVLLEKLCCLSVLLIYL